MLFDKKFYYSYIKKREIFSMIISVIILFIAVIVGFILNTKLNIIPGVSYTIPIIIALTINYIYFVKLQIQLEEMKMKLDIYNKIMEEKRED